ncbi:MAG: SMC-Scp complex subunit ScpB [Proteobacteria bacterium]|jgi:segregation and condensation protein B|nr:SMC-Scp complex subunit ScpB [Pseudomonadota bacterium]
MDSSEVKEKMESELAQFEVGTAEEETSFLPPVEEEMLADDALESTESVEGTELDSFESAEIEELEFIEEERLDSIVESVLFASDRPVSLNQLKLVFKGTNVRTDKIKRALDRLAVELAGARRGVSLEEVPGGYQLRTKIDNMNFLSRTLKTRPFKLSGPALEVLAIIAYKQPLIKAEIDEIRGVESGHLLRALMEKSLVTFEGKSDKPGRPMLYGTTKKFLEIFGLRNLRELPTLSQIDELLPEGMTEDEANEKTTLGELTENLSQNAGTSYSEGEEELMKISEQLQVIDTSTEFFEEEKRKEKRKKEADKASGIREALLVGEAVPSRDKNWLARYDQALAEGYQSLDEFDQAKKQAQLAQLVEKQKETMNEGGSALETELSMAASDPSEEMFAEADESIDQDLALHVSADE